MSIICLFQTLLILEITIEDRQFMATTKGTRRKHDAETNTTSYQSRRKGHQQQTGSKRAFAGDVEETTVDEGSVAGARKNTIEQTIKRFENPQDLEKDYRMATVPTRTPKRILAWDLGVRIAKKSDANVGKCSSINAMKHLKAAHGRSSTKTKTTEGNKRRKVEAVNAAKASALL
ncbi:uncharacterized protein PHALS_03196 [Plasmopara halstedii]|uniref:Uncharacterized protein n=1 Tax=Plasmopara halstedii TaxID=4781 RepID=A0A0N7L7B3_PLAHL|nr:uncharacterized protein PHALS_03196 [Plasmopara halstedii]CEG46595.1 hypothetical protein PHALS_03196 [Plasmopara halstedii]|eukprot:XP_024582964.1 hypothetical protein PHALS_03196 [Plasmopara halstedii]